MWEQWIGPGLGIATLTAVSTVLVALVNRRAAAEQALPDHLQKELARLQRDRDRGEARMDHLEGQLLVQSRHIGALEAHIWAGKPPPPPPRPPFHPFAWTEGDDD